MRRLRERVVSLAVVVDTQAGLIGVTVHDRAHQELLAAVTCQAMLRTFVDRFAAVDFKSSAVVQVSQFQQSYPGGDLQLARHCVQRLVH